MPKKSFAFLLVKFQNIPDQPMTITEAEQMFTAAGSGTLNVVDWFHDNTHGYVDMTGNQVFGWLTLNETLEGYHTKLENRTYTRWTIIELGRAAAVAAGIDLSKFAAVVVVTNVGVDLFGGLGGVCCTAVTAGLQYWEIHAAPSVLCQEMIHALGVYNPIRRHGSQNDYLDPYDVMSLFLARAGRHPIYTGRPIGPGLNAAFMERCGWLDHTRAASVSPQVVLRPLHRRDLSGSLYLQMDGYYVEYRPARRWDSGFLDSVVLVHYIANHTSYLSAVLRTGDEFKWGLSPFESQGYIKVDAIDDNAETATLTAVLTPALPIPVAGPAWSLFQSEFAGGGGWVILGGKLIPVPPRSPEFQLIEAAVTLVNMNAIQLEPALKTPVLIAIYTQALADLRTAYEEITEVKSPYDHLSLEELRTFERGDSEVK